MLSLVPITHRYVYNGPTTAGTHLVSTVPCYIVYDGALAQDECLLHGY
jgi:hypothetical protein